MAKYTAACEDCGKPVTKDWRAGKPKLCAMCGVARDAQVIRQMHEKSGPAYDRWLASRGPAGRPRKR